MEKSAGVVVYRATGNDRSHLRRKLGHFRLGNESDQIVGVCSYVSEYQRGAALLGVVTPRPFALDLLGKGKGVTSLYVFHLHKSNITELPGFDHFSRVLVIGLSQTTWKPRSRAAEA
mgnify:CR=1 FL=1